MFSATRMAALVAVLTLGGSFAIFGGALGPSVDQPGGPLAGATSPDDPTLAPAPFEQTVRLKIDRFGVPGEVDGVSQLQGQVSSYVVESDLDPRLVGQGVFTFNGAEYLPGVGPVWGTLRFQTEEGAWEGSLSGMARPGQTRLSGWLVGEGAYEGLSQYRDMIADHSTAETVITGIIIPGDPPVIEPVPD